MQIIPLQATPSQVVTTLLGTNQPCQVNVRQLSTGLYFDLFVAGTAVVLGVLCENRNRLVRDAYLGFAGDLMFVDTQGDDDPIYAGLGDRYQLAYLLPAEVPA